MVNENHNKWLGSVTITTICPYNLVQVEQANGAQLKIYVRRIKPYREVIYINHIQHIFEFKETNKKQAIPTSFKEAHPNGNILNIYKRNLFKLTINWQSKYEYLNSKA